MTDTPITLPLLRLGRLQLGPGLRALQPGSAATGLVVTATVPVPQSPASLQYAWDVAWADAVREAGRLGADQATAPGLAGGAGGAPPGGTRGGGAADGGGLPAPRPPPAAAARSGGLGRRPHRPGGAAAP